MDLHVHFRIYKIYSASLRLLTVKYIKNRGVFISVYPANQSSQSCQIRSAGGSQVAICTIKLSYMSKNCRPSMYENYPLLRREPRSNRQDHEVKMPSRNVKLILPSPIEGRISSYQCLRTLQFYASTYGSLGFLVVSIRQSNSIDSTSRSAVACAILSETRLSSRFIPKGRSVGSRRAVHTSTSRYEWWVC